MQRLFLPVLLTLSLLLASCQSPNAEAPAIEDAVANTTDRDTAQAAPDQAETLQRVVALTSLTADLVQTLAPNKLVGVPGSSLVRSDDRFKDLPSVSEERVPPNLETIVSLQPDLVIGAVGFHDQALQKLTDLKVPTLAVEVDSWEALERLTLDLASRLGADAQPLQSRYQACLNAQTNGAKPSVLVLSGQAPILAPNKSSWAGNMLEVAGAQNIAAELQGESPFEGYITLSPEKILQADPERIILIETPDGAVDGLKNQGFWQQLSAVQQDQVYSFDYYGLVNPGSIGSIETACQQLKQLLLRET
ncbi:MAG: ABC transporter substrate-binding protein [Synechococcales cyanobacterium CRU_2_2]|nr:ABC transporter substrate-binding protein [Synechococcales cyanobacterium CRU_2_2]